MWSGPSILRRQCRPVRSDRDARGQRRGQRRGRRCRTATQHPLSTAAWSASVLTVMKNFVVGLMFAVEPLLRRIETERTCEYRRRTGESARRLRTRCRTEWHRRPPADAVLRAESEQSAAADGCHRPAQAMRVNNTAAVMVTGTLPPYARPGRADRCYRRRHRGRYQSARRAAGDDEPSRYRWAGLRDRARTCCDGRVCRGRQRE